MSRRRHLDRYSWTGSLVRGWWLEIKIGFCLVLSVELIEHAFGRGVLVATIGSVGVAFWRLPQQRQAVLATLGESSSGRWLSRRLRRCGMVRELRGDPIVLSTRALADSVTFTLLMPYGSSPGNLEHYSGQVASALRVREVRVTQDPSDAAIAGLEVLYRDSLADPTPIVWCSNAASLSLWKPFPLGVDERGAAVMLHLPERNLLLGGEPGAGKSAALQLIVAAGALDPDVEITLFDGKRVELAPWAAAAHRFVGPDLEVAIEVLDELRAEMDARYERLLAERRRKVEPSDGLGLRLVIFDELALFLATGERKQRVALEMGLRDLVARGRAAGIIVVAATQKPSHDVIPTSIRDLFAYRLALRCTTREASDTILGQGWGTEGYNATTINPLQRGVGFLLAEGGVPVRMKTAYLSDDEIKAIARRAARLRGRHG